MIKEIKNIVKALEVGEQLKDPAKWKNIQDNTTIFATIFAAIIGGAKMAGYELPVTDEQIIMFASIFATALGVASSYMIKATSKRVGIKLK